MDQKLEKIFFALLRLEFGKEISQEIKNLITPEIMPSLFKLSKWHDLAHLVGDGLDKLCLLPEGSEERKRFLKERNLAVYRYEQAQFELDRICQALENAQIPFIPLKGSIIRRYYPEPWMRTSCDIDILVKKEQLDDAATSLIKALEYSRKEVPSINALSMHSISGVHLELHFDLTEGDKYSNQIIDSLWDRVYLKEGKQYHYVMNDQTFYFYHILHMIKHFEEGGCGVRPFLDLWLLNTRVSSDKVAREQLLEECGFLTFEKTMKTIVEQWFEGKEENLETQNIRDYILTGGTYGTLQNKVATQQVKKGGKFRYICSRIFISQRELKTKFPILQKHPWLSPFCQIVRWFKPIFSRETTKRSFGELKKTTDVSSVKKNDIEEMLKLLGLK